MNQLNNLKKSCEYKGPTCLKKPAYQLITKLGSVTIAKGHWICANCKVLLDQMREKK